MDNTPIVNAFKHIQVPLIIVGPDGGILHCNDATNRLFGYGSADLMGRPIFDILPVASLAELNAFIKAPAIDAIVKGMIGQTLSGEPILLAVQMTAWSDMEYGLQHALVLHDIADEMDAAKLVKDERKRADNAIWGAHIGIFEYNRVADTVFVSDIWRELLELDKSDAIDLQQEWRARVHPDDFEAVLESIQICLDDIRERTSCEYRLRSKDGSRWRWMQTNITINNRDKSGHVISLIGTMTDVTEHKTKDDSLRRSTEQFRSAFNNAAIGMAIVGLDGEILQVNSALSDILGYSDEDLLKTYFQTLTHPDDLKDDRSKLDLLNAGKNPNYQIEKRYIRSNGAIMFGLMSVGIVNDADGQPEHFILQLVDTTEQRRLNQVKSDFVATVSHELRTPLTSILGSLSLLSSMDEEPFSDDAQRLLFIAGENGKRLRVLINDILDFEKFSAHKVRFDLFQHHIAKLIEEAALVNMTIADKYGIKFNVAQLDRSLTGFVDPQRFQQVMTNLLTNAAKFADKGSMVNVVVERQAKVIRVSVINEGDGIPVAFRDRIFKPFSQAAPSVTRAREGTGLGLSITKQIVTQTGGEIGFESAQDGRTTFWFTVPVDKPKEEAVA